MPTHSLTATLTGSHREPFLAATQHPFLAQAGNGTLASESVCKWLVQDKYYQFAYVNFVGRLIARIDLTSYAFAAAEHDTHGKENNLQWRTLQVLLGALNAIKTEIEFYDNTVAKYGLKLVKEGPNEVTRQYVELFEKSSAPDKPMVWGLVVLWATELCYLEAWTFAKEQNKDASAAGDIKGAIAALHNEFVPNWTSDDFKAAVKELAEVADLWAVDLPKSEVENCNRLWLETLNLEAKFWPAAKPM